MKGSLLATLALTHCVLAEAQIRLFHRIYHPLGHQVDYSPRGSIFLSQSGASFLPNVAVPHDLFHFAESMHDLDGTLYQVAIQRVSDAQDSKWDFSSVKAVRARWIIFHTAMLSHSSVSSAISYRRPPRAASYRCRDPIHPRLLCPTRPPRWFLSCACLFGGRAHNARLFKHNCVTPVVGIPTTVSSNQDDQVIT
jgi:hypothetical protein